MSIAQRLSEIGARVSGACGRSGRDPRTVHVLAVSKLQPAAAIEEAYHAGQRDFGENYVQELLEKREKLQHLPGIRWHLIGHLQTNKAKQVAAAIDFFHALDSEKLIVELAKRTQRILPVFIEVNVDAEGGKAGVSPELLPQLIKSVRAEPKLKLEGLMCIPQHHDQAELMRPAFKRLAALAAPTALQLSMGMSADFEVAVEEGANWIRVGTLLFGARTQK